MRDRRILDRAWLGIAPDVTLTVVWVHTSEDVAHQRIVARGNPNDAYKLAHWDEYRQRRFVPTGHECDGIVMFDNTAPSDADVEALLYRIAPPPPAATIVRRCRPDRPLFRHRKTTPEALLRSRRRTALVPEADGWSGYFVHALHRAAFVQLAEAVRQERLQRHLFLRDETALRQLSRNRSSTAHIAPAVVIWIALMCIPHTSFAKILRVNTSCTSWPSFTPSP